MLSLLARYGDAWNIWWTNTGNTAAGVAPYARLVDEACAAIGRDPAEIMKTATTLVAVGPERPAPKGVTPLAGTPAEIAAGLRAYADVGVSHVQVRLQPNVPASWERFGAVLEELDRG
jgi:alkanesulfonate monooxygenase SsuD/methylene tetrahydromethanopterin reductase-like flavin-dependent oxidoreductase (luciferase family)